MIARFNTIELPAPDVVEFVVQARDGVTAKFRMLGLTPFLERAVELVPLTAPLTDTDQLLNIWFDFDPIEF